VPLNFSTSVCERIGNLRLRNVIGLDAGGMFDLSNKRTNA
jgi:hypothetical protein